MKKTEPKSKKNTGTRRWVKKDMPKSRGSIAEISPVEMEKVIHELHVHQVELETQNEQLRQAQIEATEVREKYANLYDFAPVGYFSFDRKGNIIEVNVTGASLVGGEKRSLKGQPFHRFITPGHFSIFQSHLQMALEIPRKQSCRLKLNRKDGSLFDALIETIAVIGSKDKLDHYRSSVTDITEITEADAEAARLATFPQLNPNPIAEVDFAGQIHYLNPAAERLFPNLRQRGTGHPWLVDWESLVRKLREGGTKVIIREVKVGGRWCQQTLHLVEETPRIRIYGMDITERKQAEEELKRLNRTLKAISDSSQAMMRSTNETELLHEVCRIIVEDCGHAMVWIGYAEDNEAKTVRPVAYAGFEEGYVETLEITWADTKRGRGPTGTAIRTGKPSACRNMLTDPLFKPWREEATERGYASSIVLPLMAGGKAFGAVNIYSRESDPFSEDEVKLLTELADDLAYGIIVTRFRAERKKMEEDLKHRTLELEAVNQELESFSYSVSHDLRAPLRAIDGYARLILKKQGDKFDQDTLDKFNVIRSSTHMMGQLIDDLLTFSRLGRKHISLYAGGHGYPHERCMERSAGERPGEEHNVYSREHACRATVTGLSSSRY